MANILVFGDSIGQGYYDKEGGWVDRLKRHFLEQEIVHKWEQSVNVFNLSISGDSIKEILSRLENEINPRSWKEHKTITIFAVGVNDSEIILKNKKHLLSIRSFTQNLNKLIKLSKKFSDKIIFIGLTPVDESKVNPIPWNIEKAYINKEIKIYDKIIQDICRNNNLPYIYLFNKLTKKNLFDGAHPNTKGHEIIFETVKNFLEEKKYI